MTEGAATIPALDPVTLLDDDDPIFCFLLKDWKQLPDLELSLDYLSETDDQRYERIHDETEHRNMNSITAWHRFATLGRYVVTFTTFTHIWNTSASDPLRLHLLIWYRYMYFLDNKIDIPKKLQDWAQFRSQDYLSKHAEKALQLDTSVDENGETWANQMTITYEWEKNHFKEQTQEVESEELWQETIQHIEEKHIYQGFQSLPNESLRSGDNSRGIRSPRHFRNP
jgi:hypothetical protein